MGELNFFNNLKFLGKAQTNSNTFYSLASTLNMFNNTNNNNT